MKSLFYNLFLLAFLFSNEIKAQTCLNAALEMAAGAGNPTTNGPSINPQIITFQNNTNNPTGATMAPLGTPITATYSLSNQQYTNTGGTYPGGNAMQFGMAFNAGVALFPLMNAYGSAVQSNFTSTKSGSGTGMTIATNRGVAFSICPRGLGLLSMSSAIGAMHYMGDLTITFSSPIDNPIIHFVDFAGAYTSAGGNKTFGSDYELITPNATQTILSSDAGITISGDTIKSGNSTYTDASIRINQLGVTSVTYRVYTRAISAGPWFTAQIPYPTEGLIIGVSQPNYVPDAPIPTATTVTNTCPNTTYNLDLLKPATAAGLIYEWHNVSSNPSVASLVANTNSINVASTYYLYAIDSISGCYSSASTPVSGALTPCPLSACTTIPDLWAAPG